jgi:hypothetical protein
MTKAAEGLPHSKSWRPEIREASWTCASQLVLSVIRDRRRFVTAGQNRVVQIGRVGFSGIKGHDYSLTLYIYPNVAHSRDAHERFAQFADAFIAILAFRRDRDSLQHRFVWAVRVVRVRWVEMLRIKWLNHWSIYAPSAALSSRAERGTSPMVCNIRISNSHVVRACLRAISLSAVKRRPSLCDFVPQSGVPRFARDDGKKTAQCYFEPTSRAIGSSTRRTLPHCHPERGEGSRLCAADHTDFIV